ncbi:MAG: 30S ribosomal protein S12 methylthiotransferase RimO [Thermodesulfobacteriota bacterium]
MKRVHVTSLGCPKNLVDSEMMLGMLQEAGFVAVEEPEEAEILLVNTCGFIQSAVEEGIDTILALAELKEERPGTLLAVTGCMVQRYGEDLARELPEVDLFIGTEGMQEIVARLQQLLAGEQVPLSLARHTFLMNATLPRQLSTPRHRAYLKATEGCANRCAYCLIPSLRGELRSRPLDDLLAEARGLAAAGVKELTLVAQDLTAYGHDLGPQGPRLLDLLAGLLAVTDIPWLRLLYLYPVRVTDELLSFMAASPRIVPYLDVPLQHVSSRMLAAMNRPYDHQKVQEVVRRIRRHLPGAAIRTTFMVGFPGETEQDVDQLEAFLREFTLDHVGIFTYSNEEGCAAYGLSEQIEEEVKEARRERLMAVQSDISLARNTLRVGTVETVLVEGVSEETDLLLEGRLAAQAPEIDGCVYISAGTCNPGDFVAVRITEAHPYDLVGEIEEQ